MSKKSFFIIVALSILGFFCFQIFINKQGFDSPTAPTSIQADTDNEERLSNLNPKDYFINDSIYIWDDKKVDWIRTEDKLEDITQNTKSLSIETEESEVMSIQWDLLNKIKYRLKYFDVVEMETYAPLFSNQIKNLNGKTVILEGFVIPFYEDDVLALSLNPKASCFFCGNASPASVMSLYLKDNTKRYKTDEFRRFKGILHLNENDPNEFYYILKQAQELED